MLKTYYFLLWAIWNSIYVAFVWDQLLCKSKDYCTRVTFYISGLENKHKYQSSKIALLFFKIFPIQIYTLLNAFEPIVEVLLPLWLIDFFERLTNCVASNISWRPASMASGTTTDFGQPSRNSSWGELRPRLISPHYTTDKHWSLIELHRQNLN